MTLNARDAYLETQVLTAPPQKLRLMLIEGAIRFIQQTDAFWEEQRWEEGLEANIRAREILGELMSSLDPQKSDLARQILPIYSFVFRTLTEAQIRSDRHKLQDALRVLTEERETWRLVCEQPMDRSSAVPQQAEITAASTPAPAANNTTPAKPAPLTFDSHQLPDPASLTKQPASAPTGPMPRSYSFEA